MNKILILILLILVIIFIIIYSKFNRPEIENFYSIKDDKSPFPFTHQFISIVKDSIKGKISKYIAKESFEVYSCSCLTPKFIQYFIEQTQKYKSNAPNSMNNYGLVLNNTPLSGFIKKLQREYLVPLFKLLFPDFGNIKDFHAFTIKYSDNEDYNLDPHTDDSDITFNICLTQPIKGSELIFCGNIDSSDHRQVSKIYQHKVGYAIIHLGKRRHCAIDILQGSRMNLVIWNRYYNVKKSSIVPEIGVPDKLCISYTHDKDYFKYFTKPPKGFKRKQRNPWCCMK